MTNDEKRAIIAAATHGLKNIDRQNWCDPRSFAEFIAAIKERDRRIKELRQRLETLERENAELRQRLKRMVKVNFEYYRQIKSLKELLKDLQWDFNGYCPICGKGVFGHPEREHEPGCKLAALLREG